MSATASSRVWYVLLARRGGSVSRHQTSGAGHQGDGGVFGEAAGAAQGHEPRVEQPLKLHVYGQACGETLKSISSDFRKRQRERKNKIQIDAPVCFS